MNSDAALIKQLRLSLTDRNREVELLNEVISELKSEVEALEMNYYELEQGLNH